MINTGITRRIDDLGRIVIPKEIRRNLKIKNSDEIQINVVDNEIVLTKYENLEKNVVVSILLKTIGKHLNRNILYTSKDKVIDGYLLNKTKIEQINLNEKVVSIINNRKTIYHEIEEFSLFQTKEEISYIISPLILNGDLLGSLILYDNSDLSDSDYQIISFCKRFLENYLE